MTAPVVEPFRPDDAGAVAALWERERAGAGAAWRRRFEWQYLRNPEADPADMGLVLRSDDGRVVGSKLWMPQRFRVLGEERIVRVSTDTIVDPDFRAHSLKLIFEYFRRCADPFALSVSAGPQHARIWRARRGEPVPHSERRHTFVLRPRRFLAQRLRSRILAPAGAALWRARFGARWRTAGGDFSCEETRADDPRLAELWAAAREGYDVTAVRDARFLRWRHAEGGSQVVVIRDEQRRPAAWSAFIDAPSTQGVRRARILDVFGPTDDPARCQAALAAFLRFLYDTGFDAADLVGSAPVWQDAAGAVGARRFVAESAFVYLARGGEATRLSAACWHIVPADGDAGFSDLSTFPPAAEEA